MATSRILLGGLTAAVLVLASCAQPEPVPGPPGPPGEVPAIDGSILIEALDSAGQPLDGAIATLWPRGVEAVTDAAGMATIDGLPLGVYRVTVAATGYGTTIVENVPVAAQSVTDVLATLVGDEQVSDVRLRVLSTRASGAPLAGATVEVDGGTWSMLTDDQGLAEFADVTPGEYHLLVTPPSGAPALPRSVSGVAVQDQALTEVAFVHSGRPDPSSTWLGSAACQPCHPGQATRHGVSGHGNAAPDEPIAPLEEALVLDTLLEFSTDTGTPVEVRLFRDPLGDHLTITTALGSATWDIAGYYGGTMTAQVPALDLGVGLAPGPVAWRLDGEGFTSSPAFESGGSAFQLETWVAEDGELVDHALTGGPGPEDLEAAACVGCHATGYELYADGGLVRSTSTDGLGHSAVERAVGCEACHGPGESHTSAPFSGRADWIVHPGKLDPVRANEVCGQCHAGGTSVATFPVDVAFPHSEEGPFEPGSVLADALVSAPLQWPSGAAAAPNQQLDDFLLSPHWENGSYPLRCFDCHDPHGPRSDGAGSTFRRQLLADPDDNSLCLSCHGALNFPDANDARDHTGHAGYDPGGPYASGRCVACHMPLSSARFGIADLTGAGDLASHRFLPVPPQETVDYLEGSADPSLPEGVGPVNSCIVCHNFNALWYPDPPGFWGPNGDPFTQETHEWLQMGFCLKFPDHELCL